MFFDRIAIKSFALLVVVSLSLLPKANAAVGDTTPGETKSVVTRTAAPNSAQTKLADASGAKSKTSKYIRIPVFYITDRDRHDDLYSGHRKPEFDSIYEMYCGKAECLIENVANKTIGEKETKLGWSYAAKKDKIPYTVGPIPGAGDKNTLTKQFTGTCVKALTDAGHSEFLVFVHGANNTFDNAVHSAAKLCYYTGRPVLLYTWPSTGRFIQYGIDAGNNEWSQEHFNCFMEDMGRVKASSKANGKDFTAYLVAHSMGNRLVVRAGPIMSGQSLFKEIYMVDPDIDAQTFIHYTSRYALKEEGQKFSKTRLLFSNKDRVLPLAQMIAGGYSRLGQGVDSILATILEPDNFPVFWQEAIDLLKPDDLQPAGEAFAETATIANGFETIDYTLADKGLWGHTIPFELIASLVETGGPGEGLSLQPMGHSKANRLTRLTAWSFKQHNDSPVGHGLRVVIDSKAQPNKQVAGTNVVPH
jgi:esterase/lipase superfamily enzyme